MVLKTFDLSCYLNPSVGRQPMLFANERKMTPSHATPIHTITALIDPSI